MDLKKMQEHLDESRIKEGDKVSGIDGLKYTYLGISLVGARLDASVVLRKANGLIVLKHVSFITTP